MVPASMQRLHSHAELDEKVKSSNILAFSTDDIKLKKKMESRDVCLKHQRKASGAKMDGNVF